MRQSPCAHGGRAGEVKASWPDANLRPANPAGETPACAGPWSAQSLQGGWPEAHFVLLGHLTKTRFTLRNGPFGHLTKKMLKPAGSSRSSSCCGAKSAS